MEFNFRRAYNLLRKDLLTNWKMYLIYSICALIFTNEVMIFGNVTFLISVAFIIFAFKDYSNTKSAISSIMLPASNIEKYIAEFIMVFIFVPLVTFIAAFLNLLYDNITNYVLGGSATMFEIIGSSFSSTMMLIKHTAITSFAILATFFCGKIFFKGRYSLVKFGLMLFGLYLALTILIGIFSLGGSDVFIEYFWLNSYSGYVGIVLSIVFLYLAYHRLKNKEV